MLVGFTEKKGDKDITEGSRYRGAANEEPSEVFSCKGI